MVATRYAKRGFTLVELVIVILVIGILATLITPRYRQTELKAQGADVATRIEAINVALKEYEADHDSLPTGILPAGAPAWLVPYMARNYFAGPSNITWQYTKTAHDAHAVLVLAAGSPDDAQILIATHTALGAITTLLGGGTSLLVNMTE